MGFEIGRPEGGGGETALRLRWVGLSLLVVVVVAGNALVVLAVAVDRRLRSAATNKFIASLAVADLLVGAVVMPLALYVKINDDKWDLGQAWCRFHLVTTVFSTTASIVHLVAISLDRYFAIIFPTEYQRHATRTSASPYIVMVWLMSLAISMTLFLEDTDNEERFCWIQDPQYLILSSLMSFLLPASVVVYLYSKIFVRLRHHMFTFGMLTDRHRRANDARRRSLPQVIVEEVRSRRGSTHSPASDGASAGRRSPSLANAPAPHVDVQPRYRSPTICADTMQLTRTAGQLDAPPDSTADMELTAPLADKTGNHCATPHYALSVPDVEQTALVTPATPAAKPAARKRKPRPQFLRVPKRPEQANSPPLSPSLPNGEPTEGTACLTLAVPPRQSVDAGKAPLNSRNSSVTTGASTVSSFTSASSDDRRSSMLSFGSSLTDSSLDHEDSRRSSTLSNDKHRRSVLSKGKLRRIASQVTRAIRRKRKESLAIRREVRATRVVAATLIAFIICWLPFFCLAIYRGICLGTASGTMPFGLQKQLYLVVCWLGYVHSCFNPIIYTCLNKNFRRTFKKLLQCRCSARRTHC